MDEDDEDDEDGYDYPDQGWRTDDYDDPDDYYDDDDTWYGPDEADWEHARWLEEYGQHCDEKHGGGECTCKPPLRSRLRWRLADLGRRVRSMVRRDHYYDQPPFLGGRGTEPYEHHYQRRRDLAFDRRRRGHRLG
jgi:hypothetical protein